MDPLWILLIGMAVVVGGILLIRLHAFLALMLGALVVGVLTPTDSIRSFSLSTSGKKIVEIDRTAGTVQLKFGADQGAQPGLPLFLTRDGHKIGEATILDAQPEQSTARVKLLDEVDSLRPGDIAVTPTAWATAEKASQETIGERIALGFGDTAGKIGILIALASIVGKCLMDSGAADRIVRSALGVLGEQRAPQALLGSGFLLGIPVFFDTVFYLMIPLSKSLRIRTGRNYLLYVLSIVAGATMTHSLVPPTPGPLFVANQLRVDMGLMILGGCGVGAITATCGFLFACWVNRRMEIPLRDSADVSLADLELISQRSDDELPPLWLSLLPILLPVILIGGETLVTSTLGGTSPDERSPLVNLLVTLAGPLGNKNIALALAAAVALLTLARQKHMSRQDLAAAVEIGLASGGSIILITAAGGAFGGMLQESGIGDRITSLAQTYQIAILPLAFGLSCLIRTAQGSSTVAMITVAGVFSDIAEPSQLGFHPLYLALVIGCGSKLVSWMNDSGFWVMTRMSGLTEAEALKTITPMNALMGFVGLGVTMLAAHLWPLV